METKVEEVKASLEAIEGKLKVYKNNIEKNLYGTGNSSLLSITSLLNTFIIQKRALKDLLSRKYNITNLDNLFEAKLEAGSLAQTNIVNDIINKKSFDDVNGLESLLDVTQTHYVVPAYFKIKNSGASYLFSNLLKPWTLEFNKTYQGTAPGLYFLGLSTCSLCYLHYPEYITLSNRATSLTFYVWIYVDISVIFENSKNLEEITNASNVVTGYNYRDTVNNLTFYFPKDAIYTDDEGKKHIIRGFFYSDMEVDSTKAPTTWGFSEATDFGDIKTDTDEPTQFDLDKNIYTLALKGKVLAVPYTLDEIVAKIRNSEYARYYYNNKKNYRYLLTGLFTVIVHKPEQLVNFVNTGPQLPLPVGTKIIVYCDESEFDTIKEKVIDSSSGDDAWKTLITNLKGSILSYYTYTYDNKGNIESTTEHKDGCNGNFLLGNKLYTLSGYSVHIMKNTDVLRSYEGNLVELLNEYFTSNKAWQNDTPLIQYYNQVSNDISYSSEALSPLSHVTIDVDTVLEGTYLSRGDITDVTITNKVHTLLSNFISYGSVKSWRLPYKTLTEINALLVQWVKDITLIDGNGNEVSSPIFDSLNWRVGKDSNGVIHTIYNKDSHDLLWQTTDEYGVADVYGDGYIYLSAATSPLYYSNIVNFKVPVKSDSRFDILLGCYDEVNFKESPDNFTEVDNKTASYLEGVVSYNNNHYILLKDYKLPPVTDKDTVYYGYSYYYIIDNKAKAWLKKQSTTSFVYSNSSYHKLLNQFNCGIEIVLTASNLTPTIDGKQIDVLDGDVISTNSTTVPYIYYGGELPVTHGGIYCFPYEWKYKKSRDKYVNEKGIDKDVFTNLYGRNRYRALLKEAGVIDVGEDINEFANYLGGNETYTYSVIYEGFEEGETITLFRDYSNYDGEHTSYIVIKADGESEANYNSTYTTKSNKPITVIYTSPNILSFCGLPYVTEVNLSLSDSKLVSTGIGNFCGCKDLAAVTLNEGLKFIGDCTFLGCEKLTTLTIPYTVEYIGANAFANTGLKNITFATKVEDGKRVSIAKRTVVKLKVGNTEVDVTKDELSGGILYISQAAGLGYNKLLWGGISFEEGVLDSTPIEEITIERPIRIIPSIMNTSCKLVSNRYDLTNPGVTWYKNKSVYTYQDDTRTRRYFFNSHNTLKKITIYGKETLMPITGSNEEIYITNFGNYELELQCLDGEYETSNKFYITRATNVLSNNIRIKIPYTEGKSFDTDRGVPMMLGTNPSNYTYGIVSSNEVRGVALNYNPDNGDYVFSGQEDGTIATLDDEVLSLSDLVMSLTAKSGTTVSKKPYTRFTTSFWLSPLKQLTILEFDNSYYDCFRGMNLLELHIVPSYVGIENTYGDGVTNKLHYITAPNFFLSLIENMYYDNESIRSYCSIRDLDKGLVTMDFSIGFEDSDWPSSANEWLGTNISVIWDLLDETKRENLLITSINTYCFGYRKAPSYLPESVTYLGSNAFYLTTQDEFTFHNNIRTILYQGVTNKMTIGYRANDITNLYAPYEELRLLSVELSGLTKPENTVPSNIIRPYYTDSLLLCPFGTALLYQNNGFFNNCWLYIWEIIIPYIYFYKSIKYHLYFEGNKVFDDDDLIDALCTNEVDSKIENGIYTMKGYMQGARPTAEGLYIMSLKLISDPKYTYDKFTLRVDSIDDSTITCVPYIGLLKVEYTGTFKEDFNSLNLTIDGSCSFEDNYFSNIEFDSVTLSNVNDIEMVNSAFKNCTTTSLYYPESLNVGRLNNSSLTSINNPISV